MIINDFYNGNPLLPKAGTKRSMTMEEAQEFTKCANDPMYFADNYFFALDRETGEFNQIKLYKYQKKALEEFDKFGRVS